MANQEHIEILKQGVTIWNQWREDNPDIIPELTEANLAGIKGEKINFSRANLFKANLSETNLEGANFTSANVSHVDFSYSNLEKTEFVSATCVGTNLSMSELGEANFLGAYCLEANFNGAYLKNASFFRTVVMGAQFGNIDLSCTKYLDTIEHVAPSSVGIDTIVNSKGKIPEPFLRGCGVPEDFITYLPSLINKPVEFYSCFISYSHADKAFARQLHDFLQGRGIRCWLDEHQLLPGHDIFEEVDRGIKLWDKVLLCASKDSLSSWWVDNEINRAFKKEQTIMKSRGKKVLALIPLDLDGYIFSDWENGKAEQVKSRLAADFQGWQNDNDKLQQQFELVLKALRTDGGREAPPVSRL